MQQLRLLSTTALLTLFIWISADQLVTKTADIVVHITVRSEPNSDMVVTPTPNAPTSFTVTLSGRQVDVSVLRETGVATVELALRDEVVRDRELGVLNLALRDEFRASATAFPGFAVKKVDPPTMQVMLDRRIKVEVPVKVRSSSLEYAVDPRVDPESVQVTILQTLYDAISSAGPRIVVDAESYLRNQPEGRAVNLDVPLQPTVQTDRDAYDVIGVTPDTVKLRATLRLRLARGTIQAVPLKLLISPDVQQSYVIEFREENPDVTLSIDVIGPPEEVERLVKGERKTFAVINPGSPGRFAGGAYQFFAPQFDLPPGVKLAEDQAIPSFEIRLVPRH